MTPTIFELQGHGDELLMSAMKDSVASVEEEEPETEPAHVVMGHGDPLFAEVLIHDAPPKTALHSEFCGHGDDILDEVIAHWTKDLKEKVAKPGKLHELVHAEFQTQGDPILKQYRDHLKSDDTGGQTVRNAE